MCRKLHEANKVRNFLGLDLCNSCQHKLRKTLKECEDEKLKKWIERNLDWDQ